jgi:hypothetical protein
MKNGATETEFPPDKTLNRAFYRAQEQFRFISTNSGAWRYFGIGCV